MTSSIAWKKQVCTCGHWRAFHYRAEHLGLGACKSVFCACKRFTYDIHAVQPPGATIPR